MLTRLTSALLLLASVFVCVFAFEDALVYGQATDEMLEQGKAQYQLLQERGSLPRYGNCWKQAIEHVDEGCRYLSEETQSDIALHLANCFLEMSGHETYNCELDKKSNLRAICINSMSDRAFNVYTEFYTHTQNMCWFLRGQVWQETISENTQKVGKQLETSAKNQEELLRAQKESAEVQEKLLTSGKLLEEVLDGLYVASKNHQDVLQLISRSIGNLQAWLVGEISWFDSIVFYLCMALFIMFFTATPRTIKSRLPMMLLLAASILTERLICHFMGFNSIEKNVLFLSTNYYACVWFVRYAFSIISVVIFLKDFFTYKDLAREQGVLLDKIYEQNSDIKKILTKNETRSFAPAYSMSFQDEKSETASNRSFDFKNDLNGNATIKRAAVILDNMKNGVTTPVVKAFNGNVIKYNLRSRQGTPSSTC